MSHPVCIPHLKSNFDLDDNEYRMQACCVRKGSSWFTTTWIEANDKSRQPFPFTARIDPSSRSGSLVLTFCPKESFRTWISVSLKYGQMFKGPLTHFFPIPLDDVQLSFEPKVLAFRFWLPSFSTLPNASVSARFASIPWIPPGGSSVLPNPIVFIKNCWADETVLIAWSPISDTEGIHSMSVGKV